MPDILEPPTPKAGEEDLIFSAVEIEPDPTPAPPADPVPPAEPAPPASPTAEPKPDDDPSPSDPKAFTPASPDDDHDDDPDDDPEPEPEVDPKPNAGLREQLTTANSTIKELEEGNVAAVTRIKELEENLAAREKMIEEKEKKEKDLSLQVGHKDPVNHPDVVAITKPWDTELRAFASDMLEAKDGSKLISNAGQLVSEYRKIGELGSEGYEKRREDFNAAIDDNFGQDNRREIIALVRKGHEAITRAEAKIAEISENADSYYYTQTKEKYDGILDQHQQIESSYFKPSPELRETDPYHPTVILSEMSEQSEALRDRLGSITKFLRGALLPMAPLNPKELESMDQEAAGRFLQKANADHSASVSKLHRMAGPALGAMVVLPTIWKQNQKLRQEVEALRGEKPAPSGDPDPTPADPQPTGPLKPQDFQPSENPHRI